jgi:pectate lyase
MKRPPSFALLLLSLACGPASVDDPTDPDAGVPYVRGAYPDAGDALPVDGGEGEGESEADGVSEGEVEGEVEGEGEGEGEEPPAGAAADVHTGGPVSPLEDCGQYPYSAAALLEELEGFGQHTEGGDPDRLYTVTTLDHGDGPGTLRRALQSAEPYWIVFDVDGTITLDNDEIRVRSRKTVDGRGRDITINGHLRLEDARHVILTDLKLTNDLDGHCTQAGDVVTIEGTAGASPSDFSSRHIWLHHLEIFNGGDGLLDIRGGTDVTVSWSHLHTHKKGLLLRDPEEYQPEQSGMRITMHHDLFDRISLRGPQLVGGRMHYANNHQRRFYEYGAGSLGGARFLSEQNVYEAREGAFCLFGDDCADPNPCGDQDAAVSKQALVTEWASNGVGYTRSVGDVVRNEAELVENEPGQIDFDPAVDAPVALEPAGDTLVARLAAGTGPRTRYCQ